MIGPRRRISLVLLALTLAATACAGEAGSSHPASSVSPAASGAVPVPTQSAIGPFPSDLVQGLRTDPDIAYTEPTECGGTPCTVPGDALAPADGNDLPTIVLLGGGSTPFAERRYQAPLAAQLAERGAVVFLMSYCSAGPGIAIAARWGYTGIFYSFSIAVEPKEGQA